MQRFLPEDDDHDFEELRLQLELAYASDRNFLEEYYKRLFDTGMDQETLAYGTGRRTTQSPTLWTEANLQNWYTDTQWLPRLTTTAWATRSSTTCSTIRSTRASTTPTPTPTSW